MKVGMPAALAVAIAAAAAGTSPAQSASALAEARRAGAVGERYDGYMGLAAATSDAVRRQVSAVNIRRRSLYTDLASRRGVTVQLAGVAAGCELLSRLSPGDSYMLADGRWRRRGAGEPPPSPEHCRGK